MGNLRGARFIAFECATRDQGVPARPGEARQSAVIDKAKARASSGFRRQKVLYPGRRNVREDDEIHCERGKKPDRNRARQEEEEHRDGVL